ncbi:hypothetical protein [Nannocystis punicea]|uniref:Uncharacterized protein n=1 Tax=Nannocystis punicea TaxID=2995304 RepID=A0ABY7H8Y1_9BACT|nr:hypothetical protein [Nannocystis poenicansa]WAS95729.1 hypothetical protein O0S08_06165 [Nannocystis poenicansa]
MSTPRDHRPPSPRLLAALGLALVLACGEAGGSDTSAASETSSAQTTAGDASSEATSDGPTTGGTSAGSTTGTDDPGTDSSTAATTGEPRTCAALCQRTHDCDVPVSLEQCNSECEAADAALRACLVACDQPVCDDLLMCTTACAHQGDPNAPPYASCEGSSATCQPGVVVCIASAHDGLEFSVCAPYCGDDDPCPLPASGTATPVCDLDNQPSVCSLDCSQGQQCPEDMVCDLQGTGFCMWPIG